MDILANRNIKDSKWSGAFMCLVEIFIISLQKWREVGQKSGKRLHPLDSFQNQMGKPISKLLSISY